MLKIFQGGIRLIQWGLGKNDFFFTNFDLNHLKLLFLQFFFNNVKTKKHLVLFDIDNKIKCLYLVL